MTISLIFNHSLLLEIINFKLIIKWERESRDGQDGAFQLESPTQHGVFFDGDQNHMMHSASVHRGGYSVPGDDRSSSPQNAQFHPQRFFGVHLLRPSLSPQSTTITISLFHIWLHQALLLSLQNGLSAWQWLASRWITVDLFPLTPFFCYLLSLIVFNIILREEGWIFDSAW